MLKIRNILSRLSRDEEGLTLVEYGIGAILAVGVGATALTALSNEIRQEMGEADGVMEQDAGATVGSNANTSSY